MVGLTGALIGSAVLGAGSSIIAGKKASKAQRQAADASVAEQRRQYDQTRADYEPWRQAGTTALDILMRTQGGDMSDFQSSPSYGFIRDESMRAIDRNRSARGLLNSGAADKARMDRAAGLASTDFENWWNRIAGVAGAGQTATAGTAAAGQNAANMISNAHQQAGNARASSYANTAGAINTGANNILSSYLYSQGGFGRPGAFR